MKKILMIGLLVFLGRMAFAQQEVLVWNDEFDTPGAPDPAKWSYDIGAGGWGNNEIQTYTNNSVNSWVENGKLIIQAKKLGTTWTSARLLTKNTYNFKYGRVVFRAKLPVGSGTWPALWMLGSNFASISWPACGEIDVMEHVGKDPGFIHNSIHTPSSYGNTVNTGQRYISTANSAFHNYQITWTYNKIEFMIDSVLSYKYSPSVRNSSTWPFDKNFFIIMNIAMGGNMGSDPQYESGGQKNGIDPSLSSATMEVEYVRVYQYPNSADDPHGELVSPSEKNILCIPNPSDGKMLVCLPAAKPVKGVVRNALGLEVYQFQTNSLKTNLDISFLPKGIYFLAITTEGETRTQKIVLR